MPPKLNTKLLKNVLKHSELMRARFCNSSWTSKTSQIDKKSLTVNKTGQKFRSKIAKLSVGKQWSVILEVCFIEKKHFILPIRILLPIGYYSISKKKEWIVVKHVQMAKQHEQCLCGRANLKFVTYLKNKKNNKEVTAGNCCILTLQ
ncbi:unnamed protein product [Rotaria sp. Silwood2]|nr:unnamed protein product [Rotaria sp. Silwood2]CAF3141482.1 unnamed protein product [Rotaria sp. Silwood2]CAF4245975.1 unnamed protein product [Rotaria sp. Silwood2]CAF4417279.1 unnamed protein product [Rotaria sp. Silwood2]